MIFIVLEDNYTRLEGEKVDRRAGSSKDGQRASQSSERNVVEEANKAAPPLVLEDSSREGAVSTTLSLSFSLFLQELLISGTYRRVVREEGNKRACVLVYVNARKAGGKGKSQGV